MQKNCGKCGRAGHNSADCRSRCHLCNSMNHLAVNCPLYPGVEPSTAHSDQCLEKVNIKIFHPRNLCQFLKKQIPSQCKDTVDKINTINNGLSLQFDNSNIVVLEHDLSTKKSSNQKTDDAFIEDNKKIFNHIEKRNMEKAFKVRIYLDEVIKKFCENSKILSIHNNNSIPNIKKCTLQSGKKKFVDFVSNVTLKDKDIFLRYIPTPTFLVLLFLAW